MRSRCSRISAPHLRIVTDEAWEAAHARLDAARAVYLKGTSGQRFGRPPVGSASKYLLTNLAQCGCCGSSLKVRTRSHRHFRAKFYGCSGYHDRGRTVCANGVDIPMEDANGIVLEALLDDVLTPEVLDESVEHALQILMGGEKQSEADRRRLEQQMRRVEGERERLVEAVLEGRELGRELGGLRSGVIHVAAGIPDLIASALGSLLGRLKLVDDLLERGGEIGPVVPKDNRPFGDGRELSDAQLLAAIRTDLARSPFHGEGHRKVHARRRILDGIRVARTRVLRVMRAHGLLSPHRGRQGAAKTHDGRVITQAPNVMWGTDGVRVFTLDDGWGWIFAAVEHWTAEYVGRHVCKVGSRFAALDPIAQGLERLYGSLDADVARGLALRMDHGSQDLSDHFLKQIRYWGIHPSFGFVEEPETNGVAERWHRTLKEQAIHGRIFQNLEAVRAAVADFGERYNQTWRLEKLGYHTPIEAREEYELRQAA